MTVNLLALEWRKYPACVCSVATRIAANIAKLPELLRKSD
jgi:hypothetical protein